MFPNILVNHRSTFLMSLCVQRTLSLALHYICHNWYVMLHMLVSLFFRLLYTSDLFLTLSCRCGNRPIRLCNSQSHRYLRPSSITTWWLNIMKPTHTGVALSNWLCITEVKNCLFLCYEPPKFGNILNKATTVLYILDTTD